MKFRFCAAILLLAAACSSPPATTADAGKDADVKGDAADLNLTDATDGGSQGDVSVPAGCQKACVSQARYLCLTDSKSGKCVECTADAHCKANPGALGNKCDPTSMYCSCAANADCAGKTHGGVCHASFKMCSCKADSDCGAGLKCVGTLFGAKVCKAPCKSAADCLSTTNAQCDVATGRCVACLKDTDCTDGSGQYCSVGLGRCVACRQDSHCASSKTLPYCHAASGKCAECSADSHCKGYVWGNKCVDNTAYGKQCRCQGSSDCLGNANGPTCYSKYRKCSCSSDTDCKVFPYTVCLPPYSGATYKNCQKACATDADCTSKSAPHCDATSGRCVACVLDTQCTDPRYPVCDKAGRRCVACLTDAHCTAHQNGTRCAGNICTCASDGDCKGIHVWGAKCSPTYKRCACSGSSACQGNSNGPACFAKFSKCSCAKDAECTKATYTKCSPAYATATYNNCQEPCAKDTDCDKTLKCLSGKCGACAKDADCSAPTKLCDLTLARCIACKSSADCAGSKVCDLASGVCVECKVDADCATHLDGSHCKAGQCGCDTDAHCKTGHAWGDKCDSLYSRCACKDSGGCSGNANGPTCYLGYKKCSCAKDSECTKAGYSKCLVPYNGAVYKQCQKPCTSDKDCTAAAAPYCQVSSGKCRACTADAHCAANLFARTCDTANAYTCVECITSADCGSYSLGNSCSGKLCSCAKDADCAGKSVGKKCNLYNKACGCAVDTDCAAGKKCTGNTSFGGKYCK